MKVSELVKMLKKSGCTFVRSGAKHDEWYSPVTDRTFFIPRHKAKEIPSGTLSSIMKDAGLK